MKRRSIPIFTTVAIAAAMAFALITTKSARPQELRRINDVQIKSEQDATAKLKQVTEAAAKLPSRLDLSQWTNMTVAAEELKKAIATTSEARLQVLDAINSSAVEQGKLRSRLAELGKRVQDREEQARREIVATEGSPLPETLRQMVTDEAEGYAKTSSTFTQMDNAWGGILAAHQDEINTIRRAEGMLTRMQQHADDFAELAEYGVAMEKMAPELTRTIESLNKLLDLFDELNRAAKSVVDSTPQKVKPKLAAIELQPKATLKPKVGK